MTITIPEKPEAIREINAVGKYNPLMKEVYGATLTLNERKEWFKLKYPNGKIAIEFVRAEYPVIVFHTTVYREDNKPLSSATGSYMLDKGEMITPEKMIDTIHRSESNALKMAGFTLWGESLHDEMTNFEELEITKELEV